jgi:hypothetical protein
MQGGKIGVLKKYEQWVLQQNITNIKGYQITPR